MLRAMTGAARREEGVALVAVIAISAVVVTLGVTALALSVHTNDQSALDRARTQALHAADAAISEVLQRFASDFPNAGACTGTPSPPVQLTDGGVKVARYRFQVEGVPGDPTCTLFPNERIVRAWGYSPASARSVRQLEVAVTVTPVAGFSYALFAGSNPGLLSVMNNAVVSGNVYAQNLDITKNNLDLVGGGNLTSPGNLVLKNNGTYAGDVTAGGSIALGNNSTVAGSVRAAAGSVTLGSNTVVGKTVRAGGPIVGDCVTNTCIPNSPSSPPPSVPLPVFTYNPANYPSPPPVTFTVAQANTYFATPVSTGLAGTFVIADPLATPSSTVNLTAPWRVVGNVTVIARRNAMGVAPKVKLAGVWTSTCTSCQFVVVSESTLPDAIAVDNPKLSMPPNLNVLLFTPGGIDVRFKVEALTGSLYASRIDAKDNMAIQASSDLANNPPPGFTFPVSAVAQWNVQLHQDGWREVVPGTLPPGSL